jgi:polysaccharide export outer membrane protein
MREMRFLGLLSVILMCLVTVFPADDSYAASNGYKLGATDILAVTIFAGGERQVEVELTISSQGFVNFPFIGSFKVAGMTSSELEKELVVPLERDYFVDPQVHIRIKEYHSLHFFISGAVKKPGKYEMQAATTIMDLVAKAEGITPDSGNVAYIMRDNGRTGTSAAALGIKPGEGKAEPIKVDLIKLLDGGDMRHNVALVAGDSVYIPFAKGLNQSDSKVYVSGEVEKPDLYQYQPGMSALSVCIMAGGFSKHAAPNRTTIVRIENGEQEVLKIDLEDVVKGKIPDLVLKPGDRIHVPESWL